MGSRPSLELTSEAGRDYLVGVMDTLLKKERMSTISLVVDVAYIL